MTVQDPDPDAPPADDPTPPAGRRGMVAALVATGAAFVLVLGLAGYLYWTTAGWQREAESLAGSNATLEQDLDRVSTELEQTRVELEAANDRLLELAGEHAQTTDEAELLRQLADRNAELADENAALAQQQNEIAVAAANAAARLSDCASGQNQLLQQLLAGEQADGATLDRVNADCQAAEQARDALVQLLDG